MTDTTFICADEDSCACTTDRQRARCQQNITPRPVLELPPVSDAAIKRALSTSYRQGLEDAAKVKDAIVWELEDAQRSHYQHFEGDSSGLVDDDERAKANKRLWAAIEAMLAALGAKDNPNG